MIVGWVTITDCGVRLWQSQRGRFFRDVASARSRDNVLYKKHGRRNAATRRRDSYLFHYQHLDWNGSRDVKFSGDYSPEAA